MPTSVAKRIALQQGGAHAARGVRVCQVEVGGSEQQAHEGAPAPQLLSHFFTVYRQTTRGVIPCIETARVTRGGRNWHKIS